MYIIKKSNNFDILRLILAIIVAIVHVEMLTQLEILTICSQFLNSKSAVDSFFIISGFLIFMSFDSNPKIMNYAIKRARRIFPGYFTVIILCAFFMFFISTESFYGYFNIEFIRYIFFNLLTLNFIHLTLPGVFNENSWHVVNGALWTIKIEVMFYCLVPMIAYIISKSNKALVLCSIYFLSLFYSFTLFWLSSHYEMEIFIRLERQLPGQMTFFISGAFLYYYFDFFHKHYLPMLIGSLVILLTHIFIININYLYPAALAVVIIYFATIFSYLGNFGKHGDLSFGVYIWHFPIIQIFIYYDLFSNIILGLVSLIFCIFIASYLSWHLVEKRFLLKSSHYVISEKE